MEKIINIITLYLAEIIQNLQLYWLKIFTKFGGIATILKIEKKSHIECKWRKSVEIEISEYLQNIKGRLTEDENLLKEISLLQLAVINGVITTNWDLFLENIFKDFKRYVGQNELIFSIQ